MKADQIRIIERLRAAAMEHGEVFDLLMVLQGPLQIDENGNKEVTAEGDDLEYLEAALAAAAFAVYDAAENRRREF